jgi:hypothetical protein
MNESLQFTEEAHFYLKNIFKVFNHLISVEFIQT